MQDGRLRRETRYSGDVSPAAPMKRKDPFFAAVLASSLIFSPAALAQTPSTGAGTSKSLQRIESVLLNSDGQEQANAATTLEKAMVISKKSQMEAFPILMRALSSPDETLRFYAACSFGFAVEKGVDISQAIPVLADILSGKYPRHIGCCDPGSSDEGCYSRDRGAAIETLQNALTNEKTKEKALSPLITALSSPEGWVRANVAQALGDIPLLEVYVPEVIPALRKALSDSSELVWSKASWGLARFLRNEKTRETAFSTVIEALSDPDPRARKGAAHTLDCAARLSDFAAGPFGYLTPHNARSKLDISRAIPALTKMVSDVEDWTVGMHDMPEDISAAAEACDDLEYAARQGADISRAIPALAKAVSGRGVGVGALKEAAKHGVDISEAIPDLKIMFLRSDLLNPDSASGWLAAEALVHADAKGAEYVTTKLKEFKESSLYLMEAKGKTERFVKARKRINRITEAAKEAKSEIQVRE